MTQFTIILWQKIFQIPVFFSSLEKWTLSSLGLLLLLSSSLAVSNFLPPYGLQHARLPCPSPSSGACLNSYPLSQWCLIFCHPLLLASIFPSIRVFSNESVLCIRWPKYWSFSFSISPPNESDQIRSVAQSCPTLFDPMNRSTPGLPVHHQLPEFTQTHVHGVSDAIQPSHPLSSPSPPAPNPSQHQSLFQWVSSSHEVAKVLEFQL